MFSENKKIDFSVKKVDKIVTWIIIGSAIASIFWLSQTKKWKEVTKDLTQEFKPVITKTSKNILATFWKVIAFIVSILFNKK